MLRKFDSATCRGHPLRTANCGATLGNRQARQEPRRPEGTGERLRVASVNAAAPTSNVTADVIRNVCCNVVIFCGHSPTQVTSCSTNTAVAL
jgi:hypothetical protein